MAGIEMRAANGRVTLSLMGDVGFDITAGGVQRALAEAGQQPLTVQLNSYGGDAAAGIAVHNMLARYPGQKTVIVEGIAASAASLIAMAGDRIVMPENAFLMIHNAWTLAAGDADAMRSTAEVLDMISASYRRTYASRTGRDEDEIARLMDDETWLTAERAVELGFATEMSAPADIRADARRLERFTKVPAALLARETNPEPAAPAHSEEVRMDTTNIPGADPAAPPAASVPSTQEAPQLAAATLADLRALANRSGLGAEFALAQLEAGATLADAQSAAIDALAAQAPAAVRRQTVQITRDEHETWAARASEALTARMVNRQPEEAGRELMGMSFHAMVREHAMRAGVRHAHRFGPEDVAAYVLAPRASQHSTSDFPGLLANSTNKTLRELYGSYRMTWANWCDEIEVDDFKQITAASLAGFPEPIVIAEGASVEQRSVAEEFETYSVRERAVLVTLSRQAIINDDLRAFQRMTSAAALGCWSALRRRVFGILTANGTLRDGTAIFAAGRGNLGTAGNLSAATLRQMFELHLSMTQPTRGIDPLAQMMPPPDSVSLLVPPVEAVTAAELTSPLIVPTGAGNALPAEYRQMIDVVPEGFLATGNGPYYMARNDIKAMEIAYLRGRRSPSVTSAEKIEHTGVTFRVLFDFEAALVQPRAIVANLG